MAITSRSGAEAEGSDKASPERRSRPDPAGRQTIFNYLVLMYRSPSGRRELIAEAFLRIALYARLAGFARASVFRVLESLRPRISFLGKRHIGLRTLPVSIGHDEPPRTRRARSSISSLVGQYVPGASVPSLLLSFSASFLALQGHQG
jgi:hypothetical protein